MDQFLIFSLSLTACDKSLETDTCKQNLTQGLQIYALFNLNDGMENKTKNIFVWGNNDQN
jgi:hypothetical protein